MPNTTKPTTRTGRTDTKPTDAPSAHAIAARLEVDAELMVRFVDEHPNPTPAIVLGWAMADPDDHVEAVEEWLDAHTRTFEARREELAAEIEEADLSTTGPDLWDDVPGGERA